MYRRAQLQAPVSELIWRCWCAIAVEVGGWVRSGSSQGIHSHREQYLNLRWWESNGSALSRCRACDHVERAFGALCPRARTHTHSGRKTHPSFSLYGRCAVPAAQIQFSLCRSHTHTKVGCRRGATPVRRNFSFEGSSDHFSDFLKCNKWQNHFPMNDDVLICFLSLAFLFFPFKSERLTFSKADSLIHPGLHFLITESTKNTKGCKEIVTADILSTNAI